MSRYGRSSGKEVFGGLAIIVVVILFFVVRMRGCTNEENTMKVLQQNGYKDITITGYRWGMGDGNDFYVTGFEATSPSGSRVSGAVCSGLLKGSVIRFD